MRKYNIVAGFAAAILLVASCSDWVTPDREIVQNPYKQSSVLRDNAYYAALREYKKTNHKIAFGWYGSWTAAGPSFQTKLESAPDSMDIISIWSGWNNLTPEQIADKEFVQKVKGTKVTFTIFLDDLPEQFKEDGEITDAAIENFARSYADSIAKYNYDGLDIDYEPGYGASGPLVGHDNELFRKTIIALGKYLGPKSGTGRLLMIDGVPYAVHEDVVEYFDYGIVQAYSSSGWTDLQNRFNYAYAKGWKPEQYIFAENFESYWQNGGVSHVSRDGETVNSLLGMARFNPEQGFGAGFGAYHMEYEYGHSDMPYKYMRRAIQDANPAGGAVTVNLTSEDASYVVMLGEEDATEVISDEISLTFSRPLPESDMFKVVYDPSLIQVRNEAEGKSWSALDESLFSIGDINVTAGNFITEPYSISVDVRNITKGNYMIPLRIILPEDGIYTSKSDLVHYITITAAPVNVDFTATELTGTKIEPDASWRLKCYNGYNTEGWTGVWNNDTDAQQAAMFDGSTSGTYWYTFSSYFNPGNFIVELEKPYEFSGFRWHCHFGPSRDKFTIADVQISNDRENWESLSLGIEFAPVFPDDNWIPVQLKNPVTAKYFRLIIKTSYYMSMDEAELWAPAAQ
ncbi:MAG: glycoside hydrolase family 18 [Candidatus Cryptobacteroides sp.]